MPRITFTRHLERFFPGISDMEIPGETVAEILSTLDRDFPGLRDYIVDETGALRKHVNIFVDGELVHDRRSLSDSVSTDATIHILQALSGG